MELHMSTHRISQAAQVSYHSSILTLTPSPCDHSRSAQAGGCRKRHPGVNFTDAGPSARAIGYPENHRTLMVAHIGETIYLLEKIYVINLPIFIYLCDRTGRKPSISYQVICPCFSDVWIDRQARGSSILICTHI